MYPASTVLNFRRAHFQPFTLTIFESPKIHSVCPPNLHKLLFSHALGNMQSPQEHLKTTTYENLGVNRVYYGGFENREL